MTIETTNRFFNTVTLPNYDFVLNAPEFKKEGEEFTVWFFEGILERHPNYIDCLMYLGNAYTAQGMYEKGLMVDQKLCRIKPEDPLVYYNLACSYALLKDVNASFEALERAIILGYKDIYHLENDNDLAHLKNDARYQNLIKKIKLC